MRPNCLVVEGALAALVASENVGKAISGSMRRSQMRHFEIVVNSSCETLIENTCYWASAVLAIFSTGEHVPPPLRTLDHWCVLICVTTSRPSANSLAGGLQGSCQHNWSHRMCKESRMRRMKEQEERRRRRKLSAGSCCHGQAVTASVGKSRVVARP